MTRPRSGEPDGPAGMKPPFSACRIRGISPAVSARRGRISSTETTAEEMLLAKDLECWGPKPLRSRCPVDR